MLFSKFGQPGVSDLPAGSTATVIGGAALAAAAVRAAGAVGARGLAFPACWH